MDFAAWKERLGKDRDEYEKVLADAQRKVGQMQSELLRIDGAFSLIAAIEAEEKKEPLEV